MNFRNITTQYNNIICSYSFNTELRPSARNIFLHLSGTKTVIVEEALTHQVVKGKRKAKSARVNDAMNIFLVTYTIRHMFLHCHHDPQSEGSHTLSGRDTLAG